jgi:hypothetical protein
MDQKRNVLYLYMKGIRLGYVKRNLMEYRAKSLSELLVRIQMILTAIPRDTSVEVFPDWMKRLQHCLDMDREFVG